MKTVEHGRRTLETAAQSHAVANKSDPFAYGRIMLHMSRGLELPSDVKEDAEKIIADRRARIRHAPVMQAAAE